jgi:hypothetical protein
MSMTISIFKIDNEMQSRFEACMVARTGKTALYQAIQSGALRAVNAMSS